jgi:hypothetical protein
MPATRQSRDTLNGRMKWRLFGKSATLSARESELLKFRTEIDAAAERDATTGSWPGLQNGLLGRLVERAGELVLTEDDGAVELEMLDGYQQLVDLAQSVERGGLPVVETQHRVIVGETCRFSAPATRFAESTDADATSGRVFLTDRRVVFLGPSVISGFWPSFAVIGRSGRDLLLSSATRRLQFRFNTFADAMRAAWLSDRLRCL